MDITLIILQLLVPLGLLIWQGKVAAKSQISWGLKTLLILGYLIAIAGAGLWLVLPWWFAYVYLMVWLGLTLVTLRGAIRQPHLPRPHFWNWAGVLLSGAIAGLVWAMVFHIWMGYQLPASSPVALTFPLNNGTYYIANGGSQEVLNAHLDIVRSKRFQELRGTSYAVDIVKLNALGTRASGISPTELTHYEIFGEPLHAPCAGVVLQAVNTLPDRPPLNPDEQNERGNFVLLQCEPTNVVVFMAHLKQGTVQVKAGDRVSAEQLLGTVGNSGSSGEPHLHINAQRPGSQPTALDGDPLPILFSDRFPVRNLRISRPS